MAPTYGSRQSQNVGEHLPQHLINTDGTSEDQWGNVRIVHIPVVPPPGISGTLQRRDCPQITR